MADDRFLINTTSGHAERIAGWLEEWHPDARLLLSTGCGLDVRPAKFAIGACYRTRFAPISAIIVAEKHERFDIYVDRSYDAYLSEWLADSVIVAARGDSDANSVGFATGDGAFR